MKFLFNVLILISFLFFSSCSSQQETDVGPDCSASDLAITDVSVTEADCNVPGEIVVMAEGGDGKLSYSLGGDVFQMSPVFDGLSAAGYNVVVKDENDCKISKQVTVNAAEGGVTLIVQSTAAAGCENEGGSITVLANGGDGNYSYSIEEGAFGESNEFTGLSAGRHTIQVKDGEGCTSILDMYLASGVDLTTEIMPIINANCAVSGCHGDSQTPLFTSENRVKNNAANIRTQTSAGNMPPAGEGTLSQEQIDLIGCWANDATAQP